MKIVNDVLDWLVDYPSAKSKFHESLIMVQNKDTTRHILDNLRLSYELFLREFLGNEKSLENQKTQVVQYLEKNEVPVDIRNMYSTLFSHFCQYNNENVKHNDKCSEGETEFIIYLTGTFMRFMIQTRASK